jgi:5-methylcytosine-specific restriction protein A
MSLGQISSRQAVLDAVREYDSLGRTRFLRQYGFGRARSFFLKIGDRLYDSKAIVGVAHRNQFPSSGTLRSSEFEGRASGRVCQVVENC